MAKKARTPSPPRKVQAPQRREHARAHKQAGAPADRQRLFLFIFAAAGVIGIVVAISVIFATRTTTSGGPPGQVGVRVPNLAKLPGALTTPPPWPANADKLQQRAAILGIPTNQPETVHYHAHLDIYDDGQSITVPAGIGINEQQRVGTVLHTHDAAGFLHVEGAQPYPYTLGQFFGVWGLNLNRRCIGGLCSKPLRVWVNGHPFNADPTRLILENHQEIVIAYGTPPDKIRKGYDFTPVG